MYIAFIHLKSAFNSVDHASLWAILACISVPGKNLRLFKKLYGDYQSCVRINGKLSEWFNINSGVRQRCVAAPDLFNCVVDHLMSRVCAQILSLPFGNLHLADLEYADDTILLSNDIEKLTAALSIYDRESRQLGLRVSWVNVGKGPDPPSLNIDGNAVEFVDSFVYLGSTVTNNVDLKPEIERRRALSSNVIQALHKPLWRRQSISRTTKMRIYNAAVLSVLLYGAETWPLTGTLSFRLDGFDSRALRSILGIHWRDLVSNETVWALAGLLFGCPPQDPLVWTCASPATAPSFSDYPGLDPGSFGWKRPRGAPRTRWIDVVRRDLDQLGLDPVAVEPLAQDRDEWRALENPVGFTHDAPRAPCTRNDDDDDDEAPN